MTTVSTDATARTYEGSQELTPRKGAGAAELMREVGSVLRMSEAEVAALADEDAHRGPDDDPQHGPAAPVDAWRPSARARARRRNGAAEQAVHWLPPHGMEKTGETLTYLQGPTNVTRMDYAAPLFNELVFSLATETLLGIDEGIPPRAQWIRMLLCELNRMSSHLLWLATNGLDLAAISMMLFGWREREETLRLLEMITGLRMNHNYIRPGGVAADLPDGWRDGVLRVLDLCAPGSTSTTSC